MSGANTGICDPVLGKVSGVRAFLANLDISGEQTGSAISGELASFSGELASFSGELAGHFGIRMHA